MNPYTIGRQSLKLIIQISLKTYFGPNLLRKKSFVGQISLYFFLNITLKNKKQLFMYKSKIVMTEVKLILNVARKPQFGDPCLIPVIND